MVTRRETTTAVNVDATKARRGADQVRDAARQIITAHGQIVEGSVRVQKALDDEARKLERLRRQIDPVHDALKKFNQGQALINQSFKRGQIDADTQISLLDKLYERYRKVADAASAAASAATGAANLNTSVPATPMQTRIATTTGIGPSADADALAQRQADYEAWGRELDRLTARFDPLYVQTKRYEDALRDLDAARAMGAVTGERYARALARVTEELSPASIAAREAALAQERLRAEQAKAEADAAQQARALEDLTAKYVPVIAQTRRYEQALRELAQLQTILPLRDYAAAWAKIEDELNPLNIAARQAAETQARLAAEAAKAAQKAADEARAMDALRAKYDPAYAAVKRYRDALADLNSAHAQGAISGAAYHAALGRIEDELHPNSIAAREYAQAQADLVAQGQRFVEAGDDVARAQRLYNDVLEDGNRLLKAGVISEDQYAKSLRRAMDALDEVRQREANLGHVRSGRMSSQQAINLSYQLNDIFTQAMGGTNPLLIAAQQGPQITQIFGGLRNTLARIPPVAYGVAAAIAGIGLPAALVATRMSEIGEQTRRLDTLARALNPQLRGMAAHLREVTLATSEQGASRSDAMAVVDRLARARTLAAGLIQDLAPLSVNMAAVLGTDASAAAGQLADAFAKGAAGVRELDRELNFLTPTEAENIRLLDAQGRRAEALAIAVEALKRQFNTAARDMKSQFGQAVLDLGNSWDRMIESWANDPRLGALATKLGQIGAQMMSWLTFDTPEQNASQAFQAIDQRLQQAQQQLAQAVTEGRTGPGIDALRAQVQALQQQLFSLATPAPGTAANANDPAVVNDPAADATLKSINERRSAYDAEGRALRGLAYQRQINLAGMQAEREARAAGLPDDEVKVARTLAEARARRDLALTIQDENTQLDANTRKTLELADAYTRSAQEALKVDAVRQATLQSLQSGVGIEDRARRLLQQSAADSAVMAAQQRSRLQAQNDNNAAIADAAKLGATAEQAAMRAAEATDAYRDALNAAIAAGNVALVRTLEQQRDAMIPDLARRDDIAAQYAGTLTLRQLEAENDGLRRQIGLVAEIEHIRERENLQLDLKKTLLASGMGEEQAQRELDRLQKAIDLNVSLNTELRHQREAQQELRDAATEALGLVTDAFDDLVRRGESYRDTVDSLAQSLLRLGTNLLVMRPLENWINGLMGGSSSGTGQTAGGLWSGLSKLGSMAMGWMTGGTSAAAATGVSMATAGSAPIVPVTSVPLSHKGWDVGREPPPMMRTAPTHLFVNAPRLHSGLAADEFPAILQRGERVIPRGQRSAGGATVVLNVTTPDASSFRASQGQITSSTARALAMARKRNG